MASLIFELLGLLDVLTATYFWYNDKSDVFNWSFFLLLSVVMYINAIRYDK